MSTVMVSDSEVTLSQILDRVELGQAVVITRRGLPVARVTPWQQTKRPIDLAAIAAFRGSMPFQEVPRVDIIRHMRDEKY